jgi:hypothetical protein
MHSDHARALEQSDATQRADLAESTLRNAEAKHRQHTQQMQQQIVRLESEQAAVKNKGKGIDESQAAEEVQRLLRREAHLMDASEELAQEVQEIIIIKKLAHAGTNDCFTLLRVLLVLRASRRWVHSN